jgi:stage II sporulation protein M
MNNNLEFTGDASPSVSFWHNFPEIGYKKWVIISSVIFIIGLLIGLLTPGWDVFGNVDSLEELAETLGSLSTSDIFIVILIKNIFVLLLCFIFSPVFCLLPILSLFTNGWIISVVGSFFAQEESVTYYLVGILPHGIFEIPALILGQAAALSLGAMTIASVISKEKRGRLFFNLRNNLKYLLIALLLLVPAAIIETYITPLLLNNI